MLKIRAHEIILGWRICAALFLAAASAQADPVVLHLKNGDRITGEVLSESATEIVLQSGPLGKLAIPRSQVNKRETAAPVPPQLVPSSPSQMPPAPPPAPKPAAASKPAPKPKDWAGEVQFGVNMRYNTKDQRDFFTTAKLAYNIAHLHNVADYSFAYGKTEGLLSANRMVGTIKTDYDLTKRLYVYNLMGAGYDEIRKVDLQYEVGPGIGARLLTLTNFVLKGEAGFTYQEQYLADGTDQTTYSARLAEMITWKIADKLVTDAKFEFFPNLEKFSRYRFRAEAIVRYSLFKNLSLNLNVIDLYDTLPAAGVDRNDLQVRSALGLKF